MCAKAHSRTKTRATSYALGRSGLLLPPRRIVDQQSERRCETAATNFLSPRRSALLQAEPTTSHEENSSPWPKRDAFTPKISSGNKSSSTLCVSVHGTEPTRQLQKKHAIVAAQRTDRCAPTKSFSGSGRSKHRARLAIAPHSGPK